MLELSAQLCSELKLPVVIEFELCEFGIGGFSSKLVVSRTEAADERRLIGLASLPGILNVTDGELV